MLQVIGLLLLSLIFLIIVRAAARYVLGCLAVLALLAAGAWLLVEYTKITLISLGGLVSALVIVHLCLVARARAKLLGLMQSGRIDDACRELSGKTPEVKKDVFKWVVDRRDKYSWADDFLETFLIKDISLHLQQFVNDSESDGQSIFNKNLIDEYVMTTWGKVCSESHLADSLASAIDDCGLSLIEVGNKGEREKLLVKGESAPALSLD